MNVASTTCLLLLLPLLLPTLLLSQTDAEPDSTDDIRPFRKGTWLSGVNGSIDDISFRLVNDIQDELESDIVIQFGLESGVFFRDRSALGLQFFLSSNQSTFESFRQTRENLTVGPFFEQFFPLEKRVAMSAGLGLTYFSLIEELRSVDTTEFDFTRREAKGIGGEISGSFHYLFTRNVAFRIALRLSGGWLDRRSLINGNQTQDELLFFNMKVAFGFRIFLDEFFF